MQASAAKFYAVAYQIQFWINLILLITTFVLLALRLRVRGKLLLLGYLALLLVAAVSWYARDLLGRFDWFKWDSVPAMAFAAVMQLLSILGNAMLLVFALVVRPPAPAGPVPPLPPGVNPSEPPRL
jgi:hypothetical protein